MVAGHGAGLRVGDVVVADDEAVHGEGAGAARDLLRPARDDVLEARRGRGVHALARDGREARAVERVQPRPPGGGRVVGVDEREGDPLEVAPGEKRIRNKQLRYEKISERALAEIDGIVANLCS